MAPKKKITDKPPKATVKRPQKPMKPSPKKVKIKIGSSVALAQLQAEASRISPKQAKKLAKQTNSSNAVKKPVKKCTPVTKKYVNKKTKNQSVDDSMIPQKQLHSTVTKKCVNKTTEKHNVDDPVTPQKQLHSPVTGKYTRKTTETCSVDDSVTQQEQLHSPVTKKCVNKTTEKHSVDDSVTPQEQLNTPVTRKYVNKRTKKHSVDNPVTPQKQLHSLVTGKYTRKTTETCSVDDSVTQQEQLHSPVTKKCVNKTTEKHSVDDSVTPQEQLNTPITRKYVNKTTEKHNVDDPVTPQKQLHSPVTKKCVDKTTKKQSVDDPVTPQKQLHSPVTGKYTRKTTETCSVDDSVTQQEQLHSPVTKKCVNKTTEKHSVDDSVTPQEQLNTPVTRKYVNKTTEKHNVDDHVTPQKQLHSPVTRKYIRKVTETCSVDDSVTQQDQLHTPVTRKYVNKTTEKHNVDDPVTPQKQLHSPVTRKYIRKVTETCSVDDSVTQQEQLHTLVTRKFVNKKTEKLSVDDSVTQQDQLHTPVTRKYVNKTTEKHNVEDPVTPQKQLHSPVTRKYIRKVTETCSVDDSVTQQEQLHNPVTRKFVNKKTEKLSVDDSVTQQDQLHTPVTIKYDNNTTGVHSLDDSERVQEQKKKRPGPKSRTMLEVIKKPATPVTEVSDKPSGKNQQKSVKSANISQEISPDNSSDILTSEGLAASDGCENVEASPIKRPRGRAKGPTKAQSKILNFKEKKNVAPMFEKVLENPSPPKPNNRPNSVISNKSNLTWTKDISTESSISSHTITSVTVTSNDCVNFNKKTKQLQNGQLEIKNDNLKQMYLSEKSTNESSSSDSESSSSSSSSSDSDLVRRRIENINKAVEGFRANMRNLFPHHNEYLRYDSAVFKGLDPDIDDILNICENFDRDLENMSQETYNSEKPIERHRTADFTEQNESEIRGFEDSRSRRSSYEDNRSETSCSPERYRLHQKSVNNDSDAKFAKPCLVRRVSAANSRDTSINLADKQLLSNVNHVEASPTDSFKTFTSDNYNYVPFDHTSDDEDALSLYAESIGGMGSSRLDSVASVSNVSLHDVYVPKFSPTSCMREKYVYRPTKIQEHRSNLTEESIGEGEIISNMDDQEQEPGTKPKEISRASSGSRAMNKTALGLLEDSNRTSPIAEESIKRSDPLISSQHLRPFSLYKKMKPTQSSLYRGFCYFYIANQCKNSLCRFPHVNIDSEMFKYRLSYLTESNLIEEYLLICYSGSLMRNFCMLFIEECIRRTETRILLNMAIDIGLGFVEIDEDLRVKVLETTLLHLNTITLGECEDLLKFEHKGKMMCDVLLSCMANSQNFAQFKLAFVKLANLMRQLNRPIDIHVAHSILERVCILPGEDFLARGMLTLMENTDVRIFESNLAYSFEVQLLKIDSKIHTVYLFAKKAALEARLAQPDEMHPAKAFLIPRVAQNRLHETSSPDSTNMDNLSEPLLAVNSAPRRFVEPTLPLWRRGGYNTRGNRRRGRHSNRMPSRVYPM